MRFARRGMKLMKLRGSCAIYFMVTIGHCVWSNELPEFFQIANRCLGIARSGRVVVGDTVQPRS
jgi:hypothetical protein